MCKKRSLEGKQRCRLDVPVGSVEAVRSGARAPAAAASMLPQAPCSQDTRRLGIQASDLVRTIAGLHGMGAGSFEGGGEGGLELTRKNLANAMTPTVHPKCRQDHASPAQGHAASGVAHDGLAEANVFHAVRVDMWSDDSPPPARGPSCRVSLTNDIRRPLVGGLMVSVSGRVLQASAEVDANGL